MAAAARGSPAPGLRLWVSPLYLGLLLLSVAAGYAAETMLALISLGAHEIAHLFVLAGFDVAVESLELHPFGGVIVYGAPAEGLGPLEGLVAVAGPLQSLVLAALGTWLEPLGWFAADRLHLFVQLNLILGCLNLLPCWPLDGARVARAWLGPRLGDATAVAALRRAARLAGLLLVAAGAGFSLSLKRAVWTPALLGLAIWHGSRSDPAAGAGQESLIRAVKMSRRTLARRVGAAALLVARHDATLKQLLLRLRGDRYHIVVVLDTHGGEQGRLTEDQLVEAVLALGLDATAAEALLGRGGPTA